MQNTTEITVKIFDDGKEPVTCARDGETCFSLHGTICLLFRKPLSFGAYIYLTPCPECLAARKEAKDAKHNRNNG